MGLLKKSEPRLQENKAVKGPPDSPPPPLLLTTQEEPQYQSISSLRANKPPTVREAQVRASSAGVAQPDIGRETEQKRNGLQGNWGYRMRRASGEEFIEALVRRERHTHRRTLLENS